MCYLVTESPPTSINLERAAHKKLHTLVFTLIGLLIYSKKTGVELGLQKNNVFENLKNEPEWLTKIKELDNGKALCSDWDLERIPDVQELGDASAIDYGDEFIALCYEHDLMDFDIDPKGPLVT